MLVFDPEVLAPDWGHVVFHDTFILQD
jgi:hypothetical protein